MSIRLQVLVLLLCTLTTAIGVPLFRTLSEPECKAYFASSVINEQLQALYLCPDKFRPKTRKVESVLAKRAVLEEAEYADQEPDDFYIFW